MVRKASLRRCHLSPNLTDEKRAAMQRAEGRSVQTDGLAWAEPLARAERGQGGGSTAVGGSSGGSRNEMVAGPQSYACHQVT